MNLDNDFVQVSKLNEDQKKVFFKKGKKGLLQKKKEHFFSPNSSGHLRSVAHYSQIIGGNADVDHTQTIGGDAVKLLREIYPPIPPRISAPLPIRLCILSIAYY